MNLVHFLKVQNQTLVFFALLAASGVGVSQPALALVFGDMVDSFVKGGKLGVTFKKSE